MNCLRCPECHVALSFVQLDGGEIDLSLAGLEVSIEIDAEGDPTSEFSIVNTITAAPYQQEIDNSLRTMILTYAWLKMDWACPYCFTLFDMVENGDFVTGETEDAVVVMTPLFGGVEEIPSEEE